MIDFPRFGPAGNSESFNAMGYKKPEQVPLYLNRMGLTAFEYQCGRGVKINEDSVTKMGKLAHESNIAVSLHAPYYISLSSVDEEKRLNSINYILQSAKAVNLMGGNRIVVHSGSCSKITREKALLLSKNTLALALTALKEYNLTNIRICPETMGKINQLGTLDEVLELCLIDESLLPCIDFGHLNARSFGKMKSFDQFNEVLLKIENKLGSSRLKEFHSHFSKIEYSEKGGEVRHLTFEDNIYGPCFEPLAELVAKKSLSPTFICESNG